MRRTTTPKRSREAKGVSLSEAASSESQLKGSVLPCAVHANGGLNGIVNVGRSDEVERNVGSRKLMALMISMMSRQWMAKVWNHITKTYERICRYGEIEAKMAKDEIDRSKDLMGMCRRQHR